MSLIASGSVKYRVVVDNILPDDRRRYEIFIYLVWKVIDRTIISVFSGP
jgi:hypothetical protein